MLTTVTMTGPDDTTDINALLALSQKYPFVEWAILMSPSREGTVRYPTYRWRQTFMDAVRGTAVKRAMHLCGSSVRELLVSGPKKMTYRAGYQRIQLNFNATHFKHDELQRLAIHAAQAEFWDETPQGIIVQYNKNNINVPEQFQTSRCTDVQVLFDASGGRGIELDTFPDAMFGFECGYAGGIGPDNIERTLEKAHSAANGADYWIDMESNVRTDEVFDLVKVEQVLAACAAWLATPTKASS